MPSLPRRGGGPPPTSPVKRHPRPKQRPPAESPPPNPEGARQPASAQDFMRFLLDYHHLTPDTTVRGRPGQNLRSRSLRSTSASRRLTANRQPHAAPGRWSLVAQPEQYPPEDLAEAVAQQLLACWGVVFRGLAHHPATPTATGWRDILKALRRFEDRGLVRGGRFVAGKSGEQFALPAAADQLQATRRLPRTNQEITIAACDPLNLTAVLFEGPRTPATPNNTLTYIDGVPATPSAQAQTPSQTGASK